VLVQLLNRFTLIEFKGPTDTLEPGDLAQLVGCAFLWHSRQAEVFRSGRFAGLCCAELERSDP